MHTRTVTLTEELEHFISDQVQSGNYADESEVVRAALKRLEYEAEHYEERIAALNKALKATRAVLRKETYLNVSSKNWGSALLRVELG